MLSSTLNFVQQKKQVNACEVRGARSVLRYRSRKKVRSWVNFLNALVCRLCVNVVLLDLMKIGNCNSSQSLTKNKVPIVHGLTRDHALFRNVRRVKESLRDVSYITRASFLMLLTASCVWRGVQCCLISEELSFLVFIKKKNKTAAPSFLEALCMSRTRGPPWQGLSPAHARGSRVGVGRGIFYSAAKLRPRALLPQRPLTPCVISVAVFRALEI